MLKRISVLVVFLVTFFVAATVSLRMAEAVPCTSVGKGCGVKIVLFGTCCLNAGGLQTCRAPKSGETPDSIASTDVPPQCGAQFKGAFPLPCAFSTGSLCGGTTCDPDCD